MPRAIRVHRGPRPSCPLDSCFALWPPPSFLAENTLKPTPRRAHTVENSHGRASFFPQVKVATSETVGLGFVTTYLPFSAPIFPPRLSPQASGLSAGSGFSAKFGCFERNIVRNKRLGEGANLPLLIKFEQKTVDIPLSQVLAQLFGVQL